MSTARRSRTRTRTLAVAFLALVALLAAWALRPSPTRTTPTVATASRSAAGRTVRPAEPQRSAAQLAQWKAETATSQGRTAVIAFPALVH
jgi:hypothetical protein